MKTPKLPVVVMITWMALPVFGAAIETISESFVGSLVTIPGTQQSSERESLFALRAVRPALYTGKVTLVGTTTITDSGANWMVEQFADRAPLYAEFANGLEADIQQIDFVTKTLSFSGALPPSVSPGAAYHIREHHTIAEIFGAGNQAGLLSGANSAQAEPVLHFIPESQTRRTYFYVNFGGVTGWVNLDYSPASNTVVYPEQGLSVRRRTSGDITLSFSGPLKQAPAVVPVFPGNNLLSLYNRATPVSLDALNLIPGFLGGPNRDAGDNLRKVTAEGISTYFYLNLSGYEGWYDSNYQPAGTVTLSPGSVFLIYRRDPSVFDWTLPAQ